MALIRSLASSNRFFMFSTWAACNDGIEVVPAAEVVDVGDGGVDDI